MSKGVSSSRIKCHVSGSDKAYLIQHLQTALPALLQVTSNNIFVFIFLYFLKQYMYKQV